MFAKLSWVIEVLATIFISCFDRFAYWIAAIAYEIFRIEAGINIFGGEGPLMKIYDGFTARIYTILSIVMVFFFAYQLLMMIVNPDGGEKGAAGKSSSLIKDSIISIVAIAALPLIFRYMTIFQNHIIDEQIIFKLILGPGAGFSTSDNPGRDISMITLLSFYHPFGTDSSTFADITQDEGTVSLAADKCVDDYYSSGEGDGDPEDVCEEFAQGIWEWKVNSNNSPKELLTNDSILKEIGGTVEYYWIISTGCAILLSWFFITYAIDLGTRAVKLAFLELIAPIPLILKIMPNSKKSFDNWKNEILRTYLDVFIRVAVVAFIVELCVLVPDVRDALFAAGTSGGSVLINIFATVGLILGLLKFAKEAPTLLKAVFATGGSLFEGLNLKPGVKARIEENELAMKGISAGANIGGRTISTFNKYRGKGLKGVGTGLLGVVRNGGKNIVGGFKDGAGEGSAKKFGELKNQLYSGAKSGGKVATDTMNYGMSARLKSIRAKMSDDVVGDRTDGKKAYISRLRDAVQETYAATPKAKAKASRARQRQAVFNSGADDTLIKQANEVTQAVNMVTTGYTSTMEKAVANLDKMDEYMMEQFQKQSVSKDASGKEVRTPVPYTDTSGVTHNFKNFDEWDEFKSKIKYQKLGEKMAESANSSISNQNMANALEEIKNLASSNTELQASLNKYLEKNSGKIFTRGNVSSVGDVQSMIQNLANSSTKGQDYGEIARFLDGAKKQLTFETSVMSERQKALEPSDTKK